MTQTLQKRKKEPTYAWKLKGTVSRALLYPK